MAGASDAWAGPAPPRTGGASAPTPPARNWRRVRGGWQVSGKKALPTCASSVLAGAPRSRQPAPQPTRVSRHRGRPRGPDSLPQAPRPLLKRMRHGRTRATGRSSPSDTHTEPPSPVLTAPAGRPGTMGGLTHGTRAHHPDPRWCRPRRREALGNAPLPPHPPPASPRVSTLSSSRGLPRPPGAAGRRAWPSRFSTDHGVTATRCLAFNTDRETPGDLRWKFSLAAALMCASWSKSLSEVL
jgi:hypothetical protein